VADEYPEAEVIGIDLSPIQPNWLPRNLRFIVDDVEADWLHKPNSIDYIHIRHMTSSIRNWPKLLAQAYRCVGRQGEGSKEFYLGRRANRLTCYIVH